MPCQAETETPHLRVILGAGRGIALQTSRIPNLLRVASDCGEFALKLLRFISNLKENMFCFTLPFLSQ